MCLSAVLINPEENALHLQPMKIVTILPNNGKHLQSKTCTVHLLSLLYYLTSSGLRVVHFVMCFNYFGACFTQYKIVLLHSSLKAPLEKKISRLFTTTCCSLIQSIPE